MPHSKGAALPSGIVKAAAQQCRSLILSNEHDTRFMIVEFDDSLEVTVPPGGILTVAPGRVTAIRQMAAAERAPAILWKGARPSNLLDGEQQLELLKGCLPLLAPRGRTAGADEARSPIVIAGDEDPPN